MKVPLEKYVASNQIKPSMLMFKKYAQQNLQIRAHILMHFFQTMKNIVSIYGSNYHFSNYDRYSNSIFMLTFQTQTNLLCM